MKHVVIALLITAFLGVGGLALTFTFRTVDETPRIFTDDDARQDELTYRTRVVDSANLLINPGIALLLENVSSEERARVERALGPVKANLNKLSEITDREENNRIVDESVGLLRGVDSPSIQAALQRLADHHALRLKIRWEADLAKVEQGRDVYRFNCTTCHGPNGDGDPITPEGLPVNPRDFTGMSHKSRTVVFKFNTSDRPDMLALDEDLRNTIENGLPGTQMPGFSDLDPEQIDALIEYVKTFGYAAWRFNQPTRPALQVPAVPQDLASPARKDDGRTLFVNRGCQACHGDIEGGGQPLQGLVTEWIKDGEPVPIVPRNFALQPLKRPHLQDMFKTIRLGVKGTPMPANAVSDEETWDLIAYVLHLRQLGLDGKVPVQ